MFKDRIIETLRRTAMLPAAIFKPARQDGDVRRDADGAVVNAASIVISASPETVFALLDPSCERNRWRLRGDRIDAVDAAHGLYRLTDRRMPDEPFLLQVNDASPHSMIATMTVGDGGGPIGLVSKSLSDYQIAPAPGGCMVSLTERTTFVEGLPARTLKKHAQMMCESVRRDLARLKEEAERGDSAAANA